MSEVAKIGTTSQFNEDLIMQFLCCSYEIKNKYFVDIGGYGGNSNCLWALEKGWNGVVLDKRQGEFLTVENINEHMKDVPDNFGMLSIDIDGNDYWIWKEIEKKPDILCLEFNAHLTGKKTIPYDPDFAWSGGKDHYFGASYDAFKELSESKGYHLIGHDQINMYFVRNGLKPTYEVRRRYPDPKGSNQIFQDV